ncbi:MAG: 5'/3'-nucleotidase SurE [Acidimicrobiales bacterium]
MRVLLTNDDGVRAPGLAHLAQALHGRGWEITIAAPLAEASGAGAGVGAVHTMGEGIPVEQLELAGLEGIPTFAVAGLPALIVISGCLGAFGPPPDLVVAGINPGRNVGRATLHSGTVGAALTAVHFDKRGLAMSIQSGPFSSYESVGESPIHFATAAAVGAAFAERIALAPVRTVINCNVPNLPIGALRGVRRAHLARSGLIRSARLGVTSATRMQLELGFDRPEEGDATDEALSALGYVTVTPLASVAEDIRRDVSDSLERTIAETSAALDLAAWIPDGARDGPTAR